MIGRRPCVAARHVVRTCGQIGHTVLFDTVAISSTLQKLLDEKLNTVHAVVGQIAEGGMLDGHEMRFPLAMMWMRAFGPRFP